MSHYRRETESDFDDLMTLAETNMAGQVYDMTYVPTEVARAIDIYKRITLNSESKYNTKKGTFHVVSLPYTVEQRFLAMVAFFKHIPEEAADALMRIRDSFVHLRGRVINEVRELMEKLCKSPDIPSFERVQTAVFMFNNGDFRRCYDCFEAICKDPSTVLRDQVEAARFLYISDQHQYRETSQNVILSIIDSDGYPSQYKYEVIASFITKAGVHSFLNGAVRTYYDQNFVHGLQTTFFFNEDNHPRYRILSGQHLLQISTDDEEKADVTSSLLEYAKGDIQTTTFTPQELENLANTIENIRADAADVIIRHGYPDDARALAHDIITELGHLESGPTNVFSNKQNVHNANITESVEEYILKLAGEARRDLPDFKTVFTEIGTLIRSDGAFAQEDKTKAFRALNRLSVDTATYTDLKISIADIFVHVWVKIQENPDEDQRLQLEKRLIEELIDMADTCASGHAARLVNSLATYDFSLKIGWDEQIDANIQGRMTARIRDLPDSEVTLIEAIAEPEPNETQRKLLNTQYQKWLAVIKKDMQKEFVGAGYLKLAEFEEHFKAGAEKWKAQ